MHELWWMVSAFASFCGSMSHLIQCHSLKRLARRCDFAFDAARRTGSGAANVNETLAAKNPHCRVEWLLEECRRSGKRHSAPFCEPGERGTADFIL